MLLLAYLGEFIFSEGGSTAFLGGMAFPTDASAFFYDPSFSARFGRIGVYGQTELVLRDFSVQTASAVVPVGILTVHGGVKTQGVSSYFYDDSGQVLGSMGERHVEIVVGASKLFKVPSLPKVRNVGVGGSAILYSYYFYAGEEHSISVLLPAAELGVSLSLGNLLSYGRGLLSSPSEQIILSIRGGVPFVFGLSSGTWKGTSPFQVGGALLYFPFSWVIMGFAFNYNSWEGTTGSVSMEIYFADVLTSIIGSRFAVAPLLRMGVPIGDDLRILSFGVGGYFTASRSYYKGEKVLATDRVDVGFNWGLGILKGGIENILSVDLRF